MKVWEKYNILKRRIESFKLLNFDWDSYGAEPFTDFSIIEAIRCSRFIIDRFPNVEPDDIFIAPISNGTIQFEFNYDNFDFLISTKEE